MTDSPLTYLDAEEQELIESIEQAPRLGGRLDPEEESRLRELLKVTARRRDQDRARMVPRRPVTCGGRRRSLAIEVPASYGEP